MKSLQRTFRHIPGVGTETEMELHRHGIHTWRDFVEHEGRLEKDILYRSEEKFLHSATWGRITSYAQKSLRALERRDISFFIRHLDRQDYWLLAPDFLQDFAFVDIETTGLSRVYNDITMIGVFNERRGMKLFVQGHNLESATREIERYPVIVTFNGSLFDIPFLQTKFPDFECPQAHIDLRFLLRRLGYSGGLKAIEPEFGLARNGDVAETSGFFATVLWSRFVRGDKDALRMLARYNIEDTINLYTLMRMAWPRLAEKHLVADSDGELLTARALTTQVEKLKRKAVADILPELPVSIPQSDFVVQSLLAKLKDSPTGIRRVVGIDLSGSERKASGWARLEGDHVDIRRISTDSEILACTCECAPDLVSIDAPLSVPARRGTITRQCELELRRRGISVFWALLPSMRTLTERGMRLAAELRKKGLVVIESYPGAMQDILQIPRKKVSQVELKSRLVSLGLKGIPEERKVSHDELDAIASALVGYFYATGECELLGNEEEGYLVIPTRPANADTDPPKRGRR